MISPCDKCQFLFNEKRKPFSMKCKHNFCTKCLTKQTKENNRENSEEMITTKQINCPKCNVNSVPFQDSIFYEKLLEGNRYKDVDRIVKVCFFGEVSVGKTSLMNRLAKDVFFTESIPTIGIGFSSTKKLIQSNTIFYQFIDTAGTENYRSLFNSQYRGNFLLKFIDADIAFIVFDVTKTIEKNNLEYWISEVQEKSNTSKIFLLGNKIDLLDNFETNESIKFSEKIIEKNKWNDFFISCKENIGISEIWKLLNKIAIECELNTKSKSVILGVVPKEAEKMEQKHKNNSCC